MNLPILQSEVKTMSSREIADLCGARHNDVIATIERLFSKGLLRESRKTLREYISPNGGRPTMVYDLTKTDTMKVVSGYNDEVRSLIIDRWQELENQQPQIALPNFTDPAEAAIAWANEYKAKQALAIENQTLKPKADAYDRFLDSDGLMTSGAIGKLLGYKSAQEFNDAIHAKGVAFKSSGVWQFYASFKDKHIGKMVGWEREEFNKAGVTLKWKTVAIDYFSSLLGRPVVQKELLDA